jgi:hypothetical protein
MDIEQLSHYKNYSGRKINNNKINNQGKTNTSRHNEFKMRNKDVNERKCP